MLFEYKGALEQLMFFKSVNRRVIINANAVVGNGMMGQGKGGVLIYSGALMTTGIGGATFSTANC